MDEEEGGAARRGAAALASTLLNAFVEVGPTMRKASESLHSSGGRKKPVIDSREQYACKQQHAAALTNAHIRDVIRAAAL